ncbi:MAG: hypothetical protein LIP23_04040 [Planctomycetes bacterium]|nr:hypothetical protein [Planctomycetota bacterium]
MGKRVAADRNAELIFSRYTREQCGLPPVSGGHTTRREAFRLAFILICLLVAGWLAGLGVARWRLMWLQTLPNRIQSAAPGEVPELLARGRLFAASQAGNQAAEQSMLLALLTAAESSPRRMGYYGSAGAIIDQMDFSSQSADAAFVSQLAAATIKTELEQFDQAFRLLAGADKALEQFSDTATSRARRLLLVNMQSYLLATVPPGSGRNPEKALHLAQLLITSRDQVAPGLHASDSAAFLDTLACAWHATGESGKAKLTQSLALGLADSDGLDVYIRHYDEFAAAPARRRTNPAEASRIAMGARRR